MFVLLTDPRLGYISRPQHHRLLGTLARKASLLSTYAFYLGFSIGIQIVVDALYLWAFFSKSRSELIERCIDGSTDQQVENTCNNFFNAGKWTLLGGMVIGLLIQSCESHGDIYFHSVWLTLTFSRGCIYSLFVRKEVTE